MRDTWCGTLESSRMIWKRGVCLSLWQAFMFADTDLAAGMLCSYISLGNRLTYLRLKGKVYLAWQFLQIRLQGWIRCLWKTLGSNSLALTNIKRNATRADCWIRLPEWRFRMIWINIHTHWRKATQTICSTWSLDKLGEPSGNVINALSLGDCMSADFKASLSVGIFNPIKSKFLTMETMKKGVKIGGTFIMTLISFTADGWLFPNTEMSACKVPFAMKWHHFHLHCLMIMAKNAFLLHKLAVWYDCLYKIKASVVDGNETLYLIVWPQSASLHDLLQKFLRAGTRPHLVVVVFDWCLRGSIKTQERLPRAEGTHCPHSNLTLQTNLPTRGSIMKNTHNKHQLIRVFCENADVRNLELYGEVNRIFHYEEADYNIISHVKLLLHQHQKQLKLYLMMLIPLHCLFISVGNGNVKVRFTCIN